MRRNKERPRRYLLPSKRKLAGRGTSKRVSLSQHRRVAGEVGFEPTNGGSKGRCLTTWRLPNTDSRRLDTLPSREEFQSLNFRQLSRSVRCAFASLVENLPQNPQKWRDLPEAGIIQNLLSTSCTLAIARPFAQGVKSETLQRREPFERYRLNFTAECPRHSLPQTCEV